MKIAFTNHTAISGSGIDHVQHNLANELSARHDVTVLSYQAEWMGGAYSQINVKLPFSANKIVSGILSPLCIPSVMMMRKEIAKNDIVITQMYPANLLPLIPKMKTKSVYIEWGVQATNLFPRPQEKVYINLIREAHTYACIKSDMVIAPANAVYESIKEYNDNTINLNLYGIDFKYFDYQVDNSIVYAKYPQLAGKKVIIFTGRISPHKNIHILIDALNNILSEYPSTILMVVGRNSFPDYQKQLDNQVKTLGITNHVIFTGLVPSVVPYLRCADVYAVASEWEGYLNPEPMAMKLPIVCYDEPIHRETVIQGATGILVKELSGKAFANAIKVFLLHDHIKERMGESSYKLALLKYKYRDIADKLERTICKK